MPYSRPHTLPLLATVLIGLSLGACQKSEAKPIKTAQSEIVDTAPKTESMKTETIAMMAEAETPAPATPEITADYISKMSLLELADYLSTESDSLIALLSGVTDKASAEAAKPKIRNYIPRVMAAADVLENTDASVIMKDFALMQKAMALLPKEQALMAEVTRIANTPEARDVLKEEFLAFEE